jgi:hypothetical protein
MKPYLLTKEFSVREEGKTKNLLHLRNPYYFSLFAGPGSELHTQLL